MVASLAIAFVAAAGIAAGAGSGQNRAMGAMWQAVARTTGLSLAAITLTSSVLFGLDKSLVVGPLTVSASTMVVASSVYSWLAMPWPSRPATALEWHEHLRSGLALLGFLRPVVLLGPGRIPFVPNSVFVPFTVVVVIALVGVRLVVERRPTAAPTLADGLSDGSGERRESPHGPSSPGLSASEAWVAAVATMAAFPAAAAIASTAFRTDETATLPLPLHPACVSPSQGGWALTAAISAHASTQPGCTGWCWDAPLTACPSEHVQALVSLSLIVTTHLAGALLAAYSVHALSMTQTRVLASQLESSKQRVLASNQGLKQFLGFVSHEVRNPLAAAQLAIDAAAMRFAPGAGKRSDRPAYAGTDRLGTQPAASAARSSAKLPPRPDCDGIQHDIQGVLDEVQASLSAARAVLDDVLEFQSMMHKDPSAANGPATALGGRVRLTPRWFDASLVTSQVALVFGAGARVSGVRLQVESTAGRVFADRKRISQVIFNLVSNAVKYSPEGSTVRVSLSVERDSSAASSPAAESEGQEGLKAGAAADFHSAAVSDTDAAGAEPVWLLASVQDEGKGMTKAESGRLFARFGRLEGADDGLSAAGSRMSSSGLGLSIVRSLVEAMGGEVRVDSAAGEGSLFVARMRVKAHAEDWLSSVAHDSSDSYSLLSNASEVEPGMPSSEATSSPASAAGFRGDSDWPDRQSQVQRGQLDNSHGPESRRGSRRAARHRAAAAARSGGEERVADAHATSGGDTAPARRVWVVDDSAPVRRVMASVLRRSAAAAVSEFADGQAALEAMQALAAAGASASGEPGRLRWPQVVLVDNHMPRLDGRGFLAAAVPLARARGRTIRFVAVTGETLPEVIDPLLAEGAAAVLCKPVRAPELLAEVVA